VDIFGSIWSQIKAKTSEAKTKKLINLGMCPGDVKAPDLKGKKLLKACDPRKVARE
jgi:hypothetical protein